MLHELKDEFKPQGGLGYTWPGDEYVTNEYHALLILLQIKMHDPLINLHKALLYFSDMISRAALQDIKALADGFDVYVLS